MVSVNGQSSDWKPVTSGIPQGSVLGPVLFVLYINDLPDAMEYNSEPYLYADDTKIFREITNPSDCDLLQRDMHLMHDWSEKWMLKFHPDKCKTMRIGRSKVEKWEYNLKSGSKPMEESTAEKDVGVIIDNKLSFDKHITEKVNKANSIVGIIRRTFEYLDIKTFRLLFTSLVRPHLEYANPVWNPYLQKHIDMIENVQRRATKMVPGLTNLSYEDRLRRLKMPTLTYRRTRGDIIEVYKIVSGKYDEEVSNIFQLSDVENTRGHSYKIYKQRARLNIRKNSFCNRIVNIWNNLPEYIVEAKTIMTFERRLDRHWNNQDQLYDYRAKITTGHDTLNPDDTDEELVLQADDGLLPEEDL